MNYGARIQNFTVRLTATEWRLTVWRRNWKNSGRRLI